MIIHWHDEVPSTMDLAHALAEAGAAHGTAVAARAQHAGRGRRGAAWVSPPGGLWLSVITRPAQAARLECLSLRVGLAVAEALEALDAAVPPVRVKWPNDLLLGDRKLAGVLCEARWDATPPAWVVVGLGMNVRNAIPPELADRAVALAECIPDADPETLAGPMRDAVCAACERSGTLDRDELRRFADRDWLRGRALAGPVAGRGAGLAADGSLLIEEPEGGVVRVVAGEVELRPA